MFRSGEQRNLNFHITLFCDLYKINCIRSKKTYRAISRPIILAPCNKLVPYSMNPLQIQYNKYDIVNHLNSYTNE